MKQTLINKYLAGETTISEERELKQLLLDTPDTQLSKAERSILELLSYSGSEVMEEDIFAVDYTEEYGKHVRPSRTIRLWPWVAAACIAALLVIFLAPPREEAKQVAIVEKTIIQQKEVKDSVKAEPISQPMQEEKQLAQVSKRNSSDVKRNRKKAETIAGASQDAVAVTESSNMEEYNEEVTSVADERMEEFYASSANIYRCGQQLKQRVATMLADQKTNPQYVNL